MVHCERCGSEAVPKDGLFHYCVACGLFVCQGCCDTTGFCIACAPALVRRTTARDAALVRRVDRRFREAEQEAGSLTRAVVTGSPSDALSVEVACLELKVATAAQVRDRVLGGPISAKQRAKLGPLTRRLRRHAAASHMATARIASALAPAPPSRTPSSDRPAIFARRRAAPHQAASVTVAVLSVAVVLASVASWARPLDEGTLSGVPEITPLPSPPAGVGESFAAAVSPSLASAPLLVDASFDDQRIGALADQTWQRPSAEAHVVAFPTPFDRSLELRSTDGDGTEACISPVPGHFVIHSLSADLRLNDAATVATINLRSGSAASIQVGLGAEASTISLGATPIGHGAAIEPAVWLQVGVESTEHDVHVRVTPIVGGRSVEIPAEIDDLPPAQAVCFGVSGEAGALVHYDNIAVVYQRSSEQ